MLRLKNNTDSKKNYQYLKPMPRKKILESFDDHSINPSIIDLHINHSIIIV